MKREINLNFEEILKDFNNGMGVEKLEYDRIWDCGLIKYIWKKPEE